MGKKIGMLVRNELDLDFDEVFKRAISLGCSVEYVPLNHTPDDAIVAEKAKGFDYVVAGRENWSAFALKECSDKLRFIARFGVGYDTLDLDAAAHSGIAISNAPGKNARSVAEQALAMTLSMLRLVTVYDREMREGPAKARLSQSLEGTFGLLGFGNVAQQLARMLQPFDVSIIAYDLYPNMEAAEKYNVKMTSCDDVLRQSDIISLHLPLLPDTKYIIRKENIDKMKDGVWYVNTARGGHQVEDDLYDALVSGKIAGAAIDAFEDEESFINEPNRLKSLPNVITSPHSAAVSTQGVRDVLEYCASIVADFHEGREVASILNPGYKEHAADR